ncbi:YbjN domain-containing protein [Psychrobacter sp. I-STPA6b]|uniref:YbjN domain-containing protein n=1 Tax=Psychrobacter sp. I-STPA6b TaxID=2585718 RepID=UPI001D0C5646|nr:YbjN domain-containing protein [Psychrobacter sp. I-STPA6b]
MTKHKKQTKKVTLWQKVKQALRGRMQSQTKATTQESAQQEPTQEVKSSTNAKTSTINTTDKQPNIKQKQTAQEKSAITTTVTEYLGKKGWKFTHYPPKSDTSQSITSPGQSIHHITLGMQSDDIEWGCLYRINEHNNLLAVYGILPFSLTPEQISAGLTLASQINYDLMLGNIEIDLRDGEIRFKNAIDVEYTGLNDSILDYLTQSVIAMTRVIYSLFDELCHNQNGYPDLEQTLAQIKQNNTEAQGYFLPTKQIQ